MKRRLFQEANTHRKLKPDAVPAKFYYKEEAPSRRLSVNRSKLQQQQEVRYSIKYLNTYISTTSMVIAFVLPLEEHWE